MDHIISVLLLLFYVYTLASILPVLLLENRNPEKSLSWVLVLVFLPIVGSLLYFLIGQSFRKRKIVLKKRRNTLSSEAHVVFDFSTVNKKLYGGNTIELMKLLFKNSGALGYADNKIEILATGEETFNAVFNAIRNAKKHIHIEFFIFDNDKISNRLRELLIQKAKEGVVVRMIYDYWGSFDLSTSYLKSLRDAGILAYSFLPFRFRLLFSSSHINYRNHRKIVIVDGKYGFTGGLNIADRYLYGNRLGKWRDTFVSIEGCAVHGLQRLFLADWHFVSKELITNQHYFPKAKPYGKNIVQIVSSGPDNQWETIMQGMVVAIGSASKSVYIQSPYYMPNPILANAIHTAALRGVDIHIMIPVESDSSISDASTSSFLGRTLEAGVKVYRYTSGFLHSKTIVIDDILTIVGSCNIDDRSFLLNFEANAFIYDPTTALENKLLFERDMLQCEELLYSQWASRKPVQKLKESFARLFSPLI